MALSKQRIHGGEQQRAGAAPLVLRGDNHVDLGDVAPGLGFVVSELFAVLHED